MLGTLTNVTHGETQRQLESHNGQLWHSSETHTHMHTYPGSLWKRKAVTHHIIPGNNGTVTMAEHSNTLGGPEPPTHVTVSLSPTGSLTESTGYGVRVCTHANTLSPDLLMKEAQSSQGYGTKIVYYKRNPTKMPNNLHHYQCPARAHLSLVMDLGRGERLFPGSTSSGRGEGSERLGGGPGRRLVPENNRGKTSGQGDEMGEYLF